MGESSNPSGAPESSAAAELPGQALVVDDDPQLRRLMERLLERDGYAVRGAPNSKEAEQVLDEWAARVWLIDATVLPDGALPLLERARHTEPRPGVLLTSGGKPAPELSAALEQLGGQFLPKPFSPAEFRRIIAQVAGTAVPEPRSQ